MRSFFAILFILLIMLSPNGITDKVFSKDSNFLQDIENTIKISHSDPGFYSFAKPSIFTTI